MKELIGALEALCGIRIGAILFLVAACYTSLLAVPIVHHGNPVVFALGVLAPWALIYAAVRHMGSWKRLIDPLLSHGFGGKFLLWATLCALLISVGAAMVAGGLLPMEVVFRA